jgi:hypothetical protein
MGVFARDGFAYLSVKLVVVANGNRYEVDSSTFVFLSGKALHPFRVVPCHNFDLIEYIIVSVHSLVCGSTVVMEHKLIICSRPVKSEH